MHHRAGVNFENFTEVKFRDILLTGTEHRDGRLNRDSPGQTRTYGRSNLNQNLTPKPNFRFIRERPFAIPSFHQKCRPPKSAAPGHCPPLVGTLGDCGPVKSSFCRLCYNQGCSGVGTRGNAFPHLFALDYIKTWVRFLRWASDHADSHC